MWKATIESIVASQSDCVVGDKSLRMSRTDSSFMASFMRSTLEPRDYCSILSSSEAWPYWLASGVTLGLRWGFLVTPSSFIIATSLSCSVRVLRTS